MFEYNEWAWQRVFPKLAALPAEEYLRERPYFWHSLHATAVHCYGAEWIWLRRCRGDLPTTFPDAGDFASLNALRAEWDPLRRAWREWLATLTEGDLAQMMHYKRLDGTPKEVLLSDLLHHVVNHGTEHRSQMTPILYALGHPTEELDYIHFVQESGVKT
jgi:uncharacterized damage-inducible protein DinB